MLSLDEQNAWREQYRRERPGWLPATEVYAQLVRQAIQPDTLLLDLGCGRGGLVEQLEHPVAQMAGVDPDFASLQEHRLAQMPRAAAPSDCLPFAEGSFDVLTAAWLLEHLPDPQQTFREVRRVLRPGGRFIFITPNARHPLAWANRLGGRLGRTQGRLVDLLYDRAAEDTFSTHYRANTADALADLTGRAGLRLETLEFVADPSYLAFNRLLFQAMSALDDRMAAGRRIHIVGAAVAA